MSKNEKIVALVAIWYCIGEIFSLALTLISPKWAMAFLYIANGKILKDILNQTYPHWQILYVGCFIYYLCFPMIVIVNKIWEKNEVTPN